MYCPRTHPIQGHKIPCQWTRYGANVNQAGCGAMPEVSEGQIKKVDDDEELGEPEERTSPQVQEAKE